jgi:hypothetical protein
VHGSSTPDQQSSPSDFLAILHQFLRLQFPTGMALKLQQSGEATSTKMSAGSIAIQFHPI